MRDGGKGDRRRKLVVPEEQFNANWDTVFKNKQEPIPFAGMVDIGSDYVENVKLAAKAGEEG
jgi:hypothetical protein